MKPHVTQSDADYGPGMKTKHCAICAHYRSPDRCEIVLGKISPQGWCRFFKKAEA